MQKLLLAETKRFLISPYYLIILVALFLIQIIGLQGWLPYLSWGAKFLDNTVILCIALSLFLSLYICDEFVHRTIQNKLILGYSKSNLFMAETIACGIGGSTLILCDTLFYLLGCILRQEKLCFSFSFLFFNTLIFMVVIGCISIFISGFSLIVRKRIFVQVFLVCLSFFLIERGRQTVGPLTRYESVFAENESENAPDSIDFMENYAAYATGSARQVLNFKVTLSPYTQCHFATYVTTEKPETKPDNSLFFKNYPYHIDFILMDIILSIVIISLGVFLFERQSI